MEVFGKTKMKQVKIAMMMVALIMGIMFISSEVSAIGITPGRTTIDFEPELKKTIPFSVINNEHKDMNVVFRIEGELSEYVALQEAIVDFSSSEETKAFEYVIELPKKMDKPGVHTADIIAMEIPKEAEENGYYVGASAAVATQLYVRVPYPGKYAEVRLTIVGGDEGEPVNFYVEVLNFGTQDIKSTQAVIDIMGPTNERIASVMTDEKSIASKSREELAATWMPDVNPGVYHAVAIVDYDNKKARTEKNFNVGDLLLDILEVKVDKFKLGEIAKFDIIVESKWNEEIKSAYAQTVINDDKGGIIADFNSASVDISAFETKEMTAYWDTENVKEGVYDGKIVLHYSGKTTEKKLRTDIRLNSLSATIVGGRAINIGGEGFKVSNVLIFLVVLLVFINAAWFIYFNKRLKKKK